MGGVGPSVLVRGLVRTIQDDAVYLAGLEGEEDDDVSRAPPAGGHRQDVGVGDELGVRPGVAVVMGVIFTEGVVRLAVEDIDPGAISGDGTGTSAVRGDLCPGAEIAGSKADGEGVGEGRGRLERGGDLLAIEDTTRGGPDAVHGALAVEGDAVVVVGLRAGV